MYIEGASDDFSYRCMECGSLYHICTSCGRPSLPDRTNCPDRDKCRRNSLKAPDFPTYLFTGTNYVDKALPLLSKEYPGTDLFNNDDKVFGASISNGIIYVWHGMQGRQSRIDSIPLSKQLPECLKKNITLNSSYIPSGIKRNIVSFADWCITALQDRFLLFNSELDQIASIASDIQYSYDESEYRNYEGHNFTPLFITACDRGAFIGGMSEKKSVIRFIPNPEYNDIEPEITDIEIPDPHSNIIQAVSVGDALFWLDDSGNIYSYRASIDKTYKEDTQNKIVKFIWTENQENPQLHFAFVKDGKLMFEDSLGTPILIYETDEISDFFLSRTGQKNITAFKTQSTELTISIEGKEEIYQNSRAEGSISIMLNNSQNSGNPCIITASCIEEMDNSKHTTVNVQSIGKPIFCICSCETGELKDLFISEEKLLLVHSRGIKKISIKTPTEE